MYELNKRRDDFYAIPTFLYTLHSYKGCTNFNKAERLAKALSNHLNSLLTLEDVELF